MPPQPKYLPRSTLNELYKLHVRPHLDYGDVIYHILAKVCEFSGSITFPNLMEKLESSFYLHCLSEWNKTDPEIRLAPSVAVFKAKLLSIIHPPAKSVLGIYDPVGLSYLSQIRVGLSKLNCHKFKHNFRDTVNPMCPMNDGIENTERFLLFCTAFEIQRRNLLAGIRPFVQINSLSNNILVEILLLL